MVNRPYRARGMGDLDCRGSAVRRSLWDKTTVFGIGNGFYGDIVELYCLIIIAQLLAIIIALVALRKRSADADFEQPERAAGRRGEKAAASAIRSILRKDDRLFTNVEFTVENRPAELDCVVVNRYGVFIIEVKNYVGFLLGSADDYQWEKYKITDAGNVYEKEVKNPIRQVKRQVYLLAKYLKSQGIPVWVRGYALLLHGNSPVSGEYILSDLREIDRVLHTSNRPPLPKPRSKAASIM